MGYFRIISDERPLGFGMKRARLHQVLEAQRFALILKVQERSLESMSRKIRTRHCAAYMLTEDAFERKRMKNLSLSVAHMGTDNAGRVSPKCRQRRALKNSFETALTGGSIMRPHIF